MTGISTPLCPERSRRATADCSLLLPTFFCGPKVQHPSVQHPHHTFKPIKCPPVTTPQTCRKSLTFASNYSDMEVFGIVILLFVLAILSVWIVPNKKVSNNEHDLKF